MFHVKLIEVDLKVNDGCLLSPYSCFNNLYLFLISLWYYTFYQVSCVLMYTNFPVSFVYQITGLSLKLLVYHSNYSKFDINSVSYFELVGVWELLGLNKSTVLL